MSMQMFEARLEILMKFRSVWEVFQHVYSAAVQRIIHFIKTPLRVVSQSECRELIIREISVDMSHQGLAFNRIYKFQLG